MIPAREDENVWRHEADASPDAQDKRNSALASGASKHGLTKPIAPRTSTLTNHISWTTDKPPQNEIKTINLILALATSVNPEERGLMQIILMWRSIRFDLGVGLNAR